ncbi:MAG TPA: YggT family protein [Streptosporangiaceae bacterium]|jgi:YggT family protein
MGILRVVLTYVLTIYLLVLIGRMIFSWIQMFARSWSPTGIILLIAESIYTVTDPPLKFLRRYIPTLRIGTVAMDLSFMVLFIVILIAMRAVSLL